MSECVFCDIVAGEAPASIVYEDDAVLAFLDIRPVTLGHTLVVPRAHVAHLGDVPEDLAIRLFVVAQRVAAALRRSGLRCEGVNMFLADGAAAFQEVFHVHLHVFARFPGDGFGLRVDWSLRPERNELDEHAALIRGGVEDGSGP